MTEVEGAGVSGALHLAWRELCAMGNLSRVVGLADSWELLSCALSYPDEHLARGLAEGSVACDIAGCLGDAGAGASATLCAEQLEAAVAFASGPEGSAGDLLPCLRRGYTALFLAPGMHVPVFPYESAFRHRAVGANGVPALFRSPVTLDVEKQMREAGVTPADARTEPVDSVWNECMFLSYLLGKRAEAIEARDAEAEARWCDAATRFWSDHGAQWLPAFMEQTRREAAGLAEEAQARPYIALAAFGSAVCALMENQESW